MAPARADFSHDLSLLAVLAQLGGHSLGLLSAFWLSVRASIIEGGVLACLLSSQARIKERNTLYQGQFPMPSKTRG